MTDLAKRKITVADTRHDIRHTWDKLIRETVECH